ncbi:DUF2793 domain-containing protein [Pseudohoeflea coraliihabitans]|uniref:DUF2793 domain-containing protein n=1 Tax=Pseudohoeflea coraliihabitans TaxID=2860393 RepID=A0ABS6WM80_9HYPH|nr:DUF2793 domain-containing protein [Pseudohoeflea sp. DP4N28-3]MBW3096890.1 DUF2793 domain-containing protein [Pseudohoeflea sp. DP4N28-3]
MSAMSTSHLGLPYLQAAQAQKHVTHNEALSGLDALVQLAVLSADLSGPPGTVSEGDRYLVSAGGSGAWQGQDGDIAAFQDGGWSFFKPQEGWRAWVADTQQLLVYSTGSWAAVVPDFPTQLPLFGVNAAADETNRMVVKADAVLHSHDDVTPGTGSARHIVNKAGEMDTASVVFQTGWSGRAEFGLTGDDDWRVKVSADGSTWSEALHIDRQDGRVQFPNGLLHGDSGQRPQGFLAVPGTVIYRINAAHAANPRTAQLTGVAGDLLSLATGDAALFFSGQMNERVMVRIWNISKSPEESAWVIWSDEATQLQVLDAASVAGWSPGDSVQIGDPTSITPGGVIACDISPMMQTQFGRVFRQVGLFAKYYASGDTAVLSETQFTQIRITPTGVSGTFANGSSLNKGVAGEGLLMIACSQASPVSDSNLVFVREYSPAGDLGIQLVATMGLTVEL